MENVTSSIKTVDLSANPAPLGLLAFGMTTILLNLHNSGLFPLGSMILAMGIFYGGLAQVIAGIMEWKKGNTFGTTAFISYGFFWLTLVALIALPKMGLSDGPKGASMVAYLVLWGVFTGGLFIGTLRLSKSLQVVFATLTILFFLLALGDYTGSTTIKHLAGYEGLICGASAVYAGMSQIWDEIYQK
ncbi:Inner membrane protein YaaH [Marinomonas spartinae]|uniref:Inner membrane protein YaaH n=1 Tax=Marinomonas spartinae TaxID=1792290 RepID=A0A1A8TJF2_9GAMM|nr:GPR1/FUN34/YaaH family transporter [Marinomonas spartinae]SBS33571.1 Inner membrane protein YaaH [Marinomonas spartinae]SBS39224.1 Inner membrane protein YaaH [Marinomonas spartinae]